jgi:hypothetical protein
VEAKRTSRRFHVLPRLTIRSIILSIVIGEGCIPLLADAPTLTNINPSALPSGQNTVQVTFTGTGFSAAPLTLVFSPTQAVSTAVTIASDTSATATLVVSTDATGVINISVRTPDRVSGALPFDTGRIAVGPSTDCPPAGDPTKPACST